MIAAKMIVVAMVSPPSFPVLQPSDNPGKTPDRSFERANRSTLQTLLLRAVHLGQYRIEYYPRIFHRLPTELW